MKLHLGAGRIILPTTVVTQPAHLAEMPESCFQPGWVNVDKHAGEGIGEVVDLFKFPWIRSSNGNPWNDNTVDEIYCAHLIEHIPHQVAVNNTVPLGWRKEYDELVGRLDGWFVFFYECWRVLKPGGLIHVVTPFGLSSAALCDPTHTRFIVPGTFSYFAPNPDAPFDYDLPCRFEATADPVMRIRGDWALRMDSMTSTQIERASHTYFDVCDEMRLTLRAVKDES